MRKVYFTITFNCPLNTHSQSKYVFLYSVKAIEVLLSGGSLFLVWPVQLLPSTTHSVHSVHMLEKAFYHSQVILSLYLSKCRVLAIDSKVRPYQTW